MISGNRRSRRAWAAALNKHMARGKVCLLDIEHDDTCSIYGPLRACDCNPNRVLMDDNRKVLARVCGAGSYRPSEFEAVARYLKGTSA